ncbi:MAG TPA: DUF4185 domain-containing protein [Polyangia bacterium]|jgi:hypothetical protein
MRSIDVGINSAALALLLALCAGGCAISLDGDAAPAPDAGGPAPRLTGCRLFADSGAVLAVSGAARSLDDGAGGALWIVDAVTVRGADGSERTVSGAGVTVAAEAPLAACLAGGAWLGGPDDPQPLLDPALLGAGESAAPLAPVRTAAGARLYYALSRAAPDQPFGTQLVGYGVAARDDATGRFVPGALLFAGDRPAFGVAALAGADAVYVYGCQDDGFLAASCAVARAPADRLADESAYEFYQGGGQWIARVEDAWPIVAAGTTVSVAYDATRARYLMAYVTPLGRTLILRSGLGPTGPWSRPYEVAACELPARDPGAFCGNAALHPDLAARVPAGSVALTYAIATFARPAGTTAEDYWTRLVVVPLPPELP